MFDDSSINSCLRGRMTHVVVEPIWRMTHVCCSNSNSFKNLVGALNFLTRLACDLGWLSCAWACKLFQLCWVCLVFPSFEVLPTACVKTDIPCLSHVDGWEFSSLRRFYPLPVDFWKGTFSRLIWIVKLWVKCKCCKVKKCLLMIKMCQW